MDIHLLHSFRQVAEDLNYSRAAEKLFVAQPALSRQIQRLEAELNVRLFDRDKRNVCLTAAGTYLNEQIGPWLATLNHLTAQTQRIHSGELGELRIGHPGSALYSILPDALAQFSHLYPDVVTSLSEIAELELHESLLQQKVDVGLTREVSGDLRLVTQLMLEEPFALVVPLNHWLTESTFKSLDQCRDEPFVLPALGKTVTYKKQLLALFAAYDYTPHTRYESNYGATILRLVEQGLGIAVLPASYQFGTALKLRFLNLPDKTQLYLVWRASDTNPVVQHFLTVCQHVSSNWLVVNPELSDQNDRFYSVKTDFYGSYLHKRQVSGPGAGFLRRV